VIHQTLRRGYLPGLAASFAPFVSDGPIILLAFFILQSFSNTPYVLAVISLAGSVYLFMLAWKLFKIDTKKSSSNEPDTFFTAVKINLLNPIPYIFWMTAGGAYLIKGSIQQAIIFVVFMLGTLALSKFALAASIRKLGDSFSDAHYVLLLKVLAIALAGFAIKLGWDGFVLARGSGF
jgi:threonine/homoserine/homoserine lactone efflux protein